MRQGLPSVELVRDRRYIEAVPEQVAAIDALRKSGATVVVENMLVRSVAGASDDVLAHLRSPTVLRALSLSLAGPAVSAEGIRHLEELTQLRSLAFDVSQFDGRRFDWLGGMTQLDELSFTTNGAVPGSMATYAAAPGPTNRVRAAGSGKSMPATADAVLATVAKLKNLRRLTFSFTSATDAGVKHLIGLEKLEQLNLAGVAVTDAGLAHLAGLRSLRSLDLQATRISDAGLKHLAGLEELEELNLVATAVTDAGLAHLAGLRTLRSLDLQATRISDAGLEHLKQVTTLKSLKLGGTQVTTAGIAKIQKALPDCRIEW